MPNDGTPKVILNYLPKSRDATGWLWHRRRRGHVVTLNAVEWKVVLVVTMIVLVVSRWTHCDFPINAAVLNIPHDI